MSARADQWDSSLYDGRHSFVWKKSIDLVAFLDPKPGERILDLGCGTGHLTAQIAERGAEVTGLDSSPSMVALARQNFPRLKFMLADAREMRFDEPFDAVFSNAALHWMKDARAVVASVATALRPHGRFVFEMGVLGNISTILEALRRVLPDAENPWYFPSAAEYATLLEAEGFEIRLMETFERMHTLEHPEKGMREWLEMFCSRWFERVSVRERPRLVTEIEELLRPKLFYDGAWHADYRRLRAIASAASLPLRTQSGMPIP
ncbi:MAG TPA: methyltransferase domain-containing protein [Bryobacteraceae bacterium]|nr:methyltransferase domain-containing protein [Bryobacteraceae bacterium]